MSRSALPSLFVLAAILLALVSESSAASLTVLLESPGEARAFDYCSWRFESGGTAEDLPDTRAIPTSDGIAAASERAAALVEAGAAIALASRSERDCRGRFQDGEARHAKAAKRVLKRFPKKAPMVRAEDPAIAEVQARIEAHWRRDQAARQVYIATKTEDREGAAFWASRLAFDEATAVDAAATAELRDLLESHDWIDSKRFGKGTAKQAWLLAQHADDHVDFQELVLERMTPHLAGGGVAPADYAYLFDRVAVNRGRLQRYGTQPDWECRGGRLELMPLEEPETVDERRASMGLGPVQQDLDRMSAATCGRR